MTCFSSKPFYDSGPLSASSVLGIRDVQTNDARSHPQGLVI